MPTLHENRRKRVVWLALVLTGCLMLATCGGGASRVARTHPQPVPAEPPQPDVAASNADRAVEYPPASAPSASKPVSLQLLEPEYPPADAPEDPAVIAELPATEEPPVAGWEAMTPEERATRLHFEGLEFEANRLSAEFAPGEEAAEEPTLLEELTDTSIPEDYTLAESREEILRRTESDLPLVLNAQVIRLINYFSSGRGLKTYRATMDRGAAYQGMIERILEEEGVPKELFHLAQAESGFLPKAKSWARATGMWQFVSFRGRQYGLRQDRHVEERYDPEKATRAAARHLKDLYIEFGDWYLAMAAYNGGPGRVARAIKRSGSRDYWTLSQRHLLRRETRNYVPIILAFTYLTKNQHLYDLGSLDPAPALSYESVTTNSEISFELLADLTDSTPETIKQLNPALLRSSTPPFDYALRLPDGTAAQFEEQIAYIPEDKRADWRRHPVQDGETLADLAQRYKVQESEIAELNELEEPPDVGMWLTIPAKTKIELYGGWGRAGGFVDGGTGRYRIASGDTLGAIASRFGVSVRQLMAWNGLPNSRIRAGRFLNVQQAGGGGGAVYAASSDPGPAPSGRYTVRRGDNLSAIASRHRVSVSDLKAWNGLRSNSINIGQVLRVPGASSASGSVAAAVAPGGSYRIRSGDNLATIASRFGVTVEDLKTWNGLRGTRIRAGDTLRVSSAVSQSQPSSQPSVAEAPMRTTSTAGSGGGQRRYRIRRGDSLDTIAKHHNVTVAELKDWNGLRSNRIVAGKYLNVGPAGAVTAGPAPTTSLRAASRTQSSDSAAEQYRIRRGDNLVEIARRYNVSVGDLQAWNGLNGSQITAGDVLTIRSNRSTPAGRYLIRRGDTLEDIAKRFGVTVAQLRAWNGLRNSRIHEGRYLTVQPEASANRGPGKSESGGL